MGVTVAYFENWDMELEPTATDRDLKEHGVWIFWEQFCGMWFVSYMRYLSGYTAPPLMGCRQNNVVASPMAKPTSINFYT